LAGMKTYVCPMHPEVQAKKPGRCPKCGMKLVLKEELKTGRKEHQPNKDGLSSYTPLVVIIGLITSVSFAITFRHFSAGDNSFRTFISTFMTGFFLVFSGFKLVDLYGFVEGYSTYDLLAQRIYNYGYIYPFIELFFGLAMIFGFWQHSILILEAVVMGFSGLGVLIKLLKREKFQCACLGTFLKVPLTKVTLVEDFGMMILALILLWL